MAIAGPSRCYRAAEAVAASTWMAGYSRHTDTHHNPESLPPTPTLVFKRELQTCISRKVSRKSKVTELQLLLSIDLNRPVGGGGGGGVWLWVCFVFLLLFVCFVLVSEMGLSLSLGWA